MRERESNESLHTLAVTGLIPSVKLAMSECSLVLVDILGWSFDPASLAARDLVNMTSSLGGALDSRS